ncbi:TetR/AcrR family transcriptional regulator [Streptomyces daliensis]|uniref:TetR family transcriptional regulator n=1 Tax=Streptomyces daliensis TaxID=299421 RepID=A0A8T4IVQ3_9ACTN|nr:TetR family transcriptional regulator [Streptomyces daliensis]
MTEQQQGLRERKRQRTYEAISEAAIALFLERGFDQVSVAEIAEAAEVSKPTLFRYFPAKEDMALYRFGDHEDEAARVVRGRAPDTSPLAALHAHFLRGLAERDPVTGLCDHEAVLAFHRLLYGTPSLVARLHAYTSRSEHALATALHEAAHGSGNGGGGGAARSAEEPESEPGLTARLAAGQIVAVQRILALDNWRRIADGTPADEVYEGAVEAAEHAFALLRSGLPDPDGAPREEGTGNASAR